MSVKISELYGTEVYTSKAKHVGKVEDIILNLQKGEIMRLTLSPLKSGFLSKAKVEEILKENSIGYNDVEQVGDIILVKPTVRVAKEVAH
ncbi:MAG: PRC-barrel domain-containing protein [Candidatus Altiarchaeota archaeon]|nr:PRC-barrel domain-containing protein [Candidatus Altiarchaeota archaeon]